MILSSCDRLTDPILTVSRALPYVAVVSYWTPFQDFARLSAPNHW